MKKKIFTAILASSLATSAMAAEPGAYGLAGIGLSPMADNAGRTMAFGINAGVGYNLNRYVGFEAQTGVLGLGNSVSAIPVAASVQAFVPVLKGIDLYGKYGTSYTTLSSGSGATTSSASGTTSLWGVGLEFSPPGSKETYRIGVEHYDLAVSPGMSLSTNYLNLTGTTRF